MPTYDVHDALIVAHAVLASLVLFFLLPTSLISGRYLRSYTSSSWFKIHSYLMYINMFLICCIFAFGTAAVRWLGAGQQFTGDEADWHHRFGFGMFMLFMLQGIFGFVAHYTRGTNVELRSIPSTTNKPSPYPFPFNFNFSHRPPLILPGKSIVRYVHMVSGVVVTGLLIACYYSGLREWDTMADNMTRTPEAIFFLFWILLILWVLAYGVVGFAWEGERRKWFLRWVDGTEGEGDKIVQVEKGAGSEKKCEEICC